MAKKKVLFLCNNSSARSQMVEALLRKFYGNIFETFSAGTQPTMVNPFAISVKTEIGIDISRHRLKSVEEFRGHEFDHVVTVCDNAKDTCPFFTDEKEYSILNPVNWIGKKRCKEVL